MTDGPETYQALQHTMQAGVGAEQSAKPGFQNYDEVLLRHFKHERVGINSALVESSALAKLLMEKGVFTEEEYWTTLCDLMRAEIARYEARLSAAMGSKITLGTLYG